MARFFWNTEEVVPPRVVAHIRACLHMTVNALARSTRLTVVISVRKDTWQVTLGTNVVAVGAGFQFTRVRVVAVVAGHSRLVHFALQK